MDLAVRGHPLHTRLQTVVLRRGDGGGIVADAEHLDLRKRGFVPVGADLQPSGVIHQMSLHCSVDLERRALGDVRSEMAVPAFDATELTRGESCRDVSGGHAELDGLALGDGAASSIGGAMGRARGCSHLLALTHLTTAALGHAIDRGAELGAEWSSGAARRLFHRALVIDGAQPAGDEIEMGVQLNDVFFAPAPAVSNPMDRFLAHNELRLLARIDLERVVVTELAVAERARGRDDLASEAWIRRDDDVRDLVGAPFLGGFAAKVLETSARSGCSAPLVDCLLALAPAFIQVCACFSEDWPQRCMARDTTVGIGGMPDSCYMWRRDGALHGRKKKTDPLGTL